MRRYLIGWAGLLVGLFALGCGGAPSTGDVTGVNTFNGAPVEAGAITFIPSDGKSPTAGCTVTQGRYSARVPVGKAKVVINGTKVVGKKKVYNTPDSPVMPVTQELLPAKYSDNGKTELTFDVKPGQNEKNWELTK
jgi:hypothetical protein